MPSAPWSATGNDAGLEEVVACVVPVAGQQLDAGGLIAFCRDGLASFKRPRQVLALDALPKTASGKIQRGVCVTWWRSGSLRPGGDRVPIYALDALVPAIDPDAYVHPDAVVIGKVELAAGSSVWPGAVLRADHGLIQVGARTSIQDGTIIHTTREWPTVIGAGCWWGTARTSKGAWSGTAA